MDDAETKRLLSAIEASDSSAHELRRLFDEVVARLGNERASAVWWSAFAATDASET